MPASVRTSTKIRLVRPAKRRWGITSVTRSRSSGLPDTAFAAIVVSFTSLPSLPVRHGAVVMPERRRPAHHWRETLRRLEVERDPQPWGAGHGEEPLLIHRGRIGDDRVLPWLGLGDDLLQQEVG